MRAFNLCLKIGAYFILVLMIGGCQNTTEEERIITANNKIVKICDKLRFANDPKLQLLWSQLEHYERDPSEFIQVQLAISLGNLAKLNRNDLSERAVSMLVSLLQNGRLPAKKTAAQSLSLYGATAAPAIHELENVIRMYSELDVSWFAAKTLGAIGSKADTALPTLIWALEHKGKAGLYQYELRRSAVSALGFMGKSARSALPTLRAVCEGSDTITNSEIKQAIDAIENAP